MRRLFGSHIDSTKCVHGIHFISLWIWTLHFTKWSTVTIEKCHHFRGNINENCIFMGRTVFFLFVRGIVAMSFVWKLLYASCCVFRFRVFFLYVRWNLLPRLRKIQIQRLQMHFSLKTQSSIYAGNRLAAAAADDTNHFFHRIHFFSFCASLI